MYSFLIINVRFNAGLLIGASWECEHRLGDTPVGQSDSMWHALPSTKEICAQRFRSVIVFLN